MNNKEIDDARRMLVKILAKDDDGPIIGFEILTEEDRLFLTTTCSMAMIQSTLCIQSRYDAEDALRGLDALVEDARDQIRQICDGD